MTVEFPTPTPHQHRESEYLALPSPDGRRVTRANYGGMGSGKTLTELMAIEKIAPDFSKEIVIIVCPPIATKMWLDLAAEYLGHPSQFVQGKTRIDPEIPILVMTYAIATKRVAELRGLKVCVLVLDEGHACKDEESQRTKAMFGNLGLAVKADYTHVLTGTPKPKWNDDLWPFLVHAKPVELKALIGELTLDRFRLRYCITQRRKFHPYQKIPTILTVGNRKTEELSALLYDGDYPAAVRTELEEAFANMPPLTMNTLGIQLKGSVEFRKLLAAVEGMSISEVQSGIQSQEPGLAELRRKIGEAKVPEAVKEIISRIEAGVTPILVGCWHRNVIEALKQGLKKYRVGEISGRTNSAADQRTKQSFIDGELDVLVGQIAAMGTALDGLQATGNYIIALELDWSPDIMDQFYARLRRGGQKRHVHVDIFDGGTKIEEALVDISSRKAAESRKLHRINRRA